jgi:hypothetical protein
MLLSILGKFQGFQELGARNQGQRPNVVLVILYLPSQLKSLSILLLPQEAS